MMLRPRTRRDALLAGCFLLLLGQVCPWAYSEDNREICLLPKEQGPCKAIIDAWYYDRYSQTCEEFFYGGCGGNDNNFPTEEECEETCHKIKRVAKECRLEVNEGTCGAFNSRYFFNLNRMRCEAFAYTGCGGNENQFFTKISCLEYCLPEENHREICLLPKEKGQCKARRLMWYYDRYSQTCKEFFYGGCGGNENIFPTEEECEETCHNIKKNPFTIKETEAEHTKPLLQEPLSGTHRWMGSFWKKRREDQPYAYDP